MCGIWALCLVKQWENIFCVLEFSYNPLIIMIKKNTDFICWSLLVFTQNCHFTCMVMLKLIRKHNKTIKLNAKVYEILQLNVGMYALMKTIYKFKRFHSLIHVLRNGYIKTLLFSIFCGKKNSQKYTNHHEIFFNILKL